MPFSLLSADAEHEWDPFATLRMTEVMNKYLYCLPKFSVTDN